MRPPISPHERALHAPARKRGRDLECPLSTPEIAPVAADLGWWRCAYNAAYTTPHNGRRATLREGLCVVCVLRVHLVTSSGALEGVAARTLVGA